MSRPSELAPLPDGYGPLYERALEVLRERTRAIWLGGSVARGVADAGSDLDLIVAVDDAALEQFRASHREWLAAIAPMVLVRLEATFVHCVTATCERFDVVMEPVSALGETPFRHRLPVHDPDGLHALVPPPPRPAGPDVATMRGLAEEFLRMQSIFPAAVVAREDWLLGVVGVLNNQQLLYALFVEANQPLPPTGLKQWSAKLTPEQRAVLMALRVPQPERGDLIEALRGTQRAWREHGRAALLAAGGEWPEELDAAVTAFWERELSSP